MVEKQQEMIKEVVEKVKKENEAKKQAELKAWVEEQKRKKEAEEKRIKLEREK